MKPITNCEVIFIGFVVTIAAEIIYLLVRGKE
jgi:hypothetical protein